MLSGNRLSKVNAKAPSRTWSNFISPRVWKSWSDFAIRWTKTTWPTWWALTSETRIQKTRWNKTTKSINNQLPALLTPDRCHSACKWRAPQSRQEMRISVDSQSQLENPTRRSMKWFTKKSMSKKKMLRKKNKSNQFKLNNQLKEHKRLTCLPNRTLPTICRKRRCWLKVEISSLIYRKRGRTHLLTTPVLTKWWRKWNDR